MRLRGKLCTNGQATYDNMAHAHCMLDTEGSSVTALCTSYLCKTQLTAVLHLKIWF